MEATKIQKSNAHFFTVKVDEMSNLGWKKGDIVKKEIINGKLIVSKVE